MLTIRFQRIGKKKKPHFRIIISEKTKDTQGKYLELLGHYDPHTKQVSFKADRIKHWIATGATLSNSVFNLLVNHKLIDEKEKRRSVFLSAKRAGKIAEKKNAATADAEKAAAGTLKPAEETETKEEPTEEAPAA